MKVLVTGAGGFVGRHLITELLHETTWKIVALDRKDSRLPRESARLRSIGEDLADPPLNSPWLDDVDAVINLASSSDVPEFLRNPVRHTMNNVTSTLNLLEWARYRELKTFIQVSTNEVYGPRDDGSFSLEQDQLIPQTPYSASKACQEMLGIGWRQTYGVPVVIVNTMHLFGEGQPRQRFVPATIDRILNGEKVPIFRHPQGAPVRQWTYVGDFARALRVLIEDSDHSHVARWHIAGTELSCLEVARILGTKLHQDFEVEWLSAEKRRPGYDYRYALATDRFRIAFDYEPTYGTDVGLRRTIGWVKRERNEA